MSQEATLELALAWLWLLVPHLGVFFSLNNSTYFSLQESVETDVPLSVLKFYCSVLLVYFKHTQYNVVFFLEIVYSQYKQHQIVHKIQFLYCFPFRPDSVLSAHEPLDDPSLIPIYASINQNEVRGIQRRQQQQQQSTEQQQDDIPSQPRSRPTSRPPSQAANASNPMYSSIDHLSLEARRSFVVQRNERIHPIPRSNSSSAITHRRTRSEDPEEEIETETSEGPPLYSTIIPRHLRQHHSSSTEQELGQEEGGAEEQEVPDSQTYSTLKH